MARVGAVDIIVYASGVEAMKNAWLEEQGGRGKFMESAELEEELAKELAALKSRIDELKLPLGILGNVERAWSMSGGQEMRGFLEALKLPIGAADQEPDR